MTDFNRDKYFAELEDEELLDALTEKIEQYYEDLQGRGLHNLLEKCYRAYYGGDLSSKQLQLFDSSGVKAGGKQGEIARLKVNHYRNLVKHSLNLTTQQKPAVQARAANSDYKSQTQALLANGLLDYYWREKKLKKSLVKAVEWGYALLEGWIHAPWNTEIGDVYDVDDKDNKQMSGDLEFSVHGMMDVIRNTDLKDSDEFDWLILRETKNRWDLIARYPEVKEELLSITGDEAIGDIDEFDYSFKNGDKKDEDMLKVYTFYHNRTEALPNGRLVVFIEDVILFEGDMPYSKMPLFGFMPDRILNSPYGYTPAAELLGPQQALDILNSSIMTNQATNAIGKIWSQDGRLTVKNFTGGIKILHSDTEPKPLNFTATPAEVFNYVNKLESGMETVSGISSTVRGNPEANLKSGNALALVVSQSIQFASLGESMYNDVIEELGTSIIFTLRDMSATPRVASIVGEANQPYVREYTSEDLKNISRVVVEQVNPLSKTIAGRIELANNFMQQGFIKSPEQYQHVLNTGTIEELSEGAQNETLNIRAENEAMRKGEVVQVVMTENHAEHIRRHKQIIENPESKKDPEIIKNVLSHIQEHLNIWRQTPIEILAVLGYAPPPAPAAPPQSPSAPQSGPMQAMPQQPDPQQNMPNMPGLPEGAPQESQQAYDQMKGNLDGI